MKRNFTFLMAAFALMVSMMMPLGMKGQVRATNTLLSEDFSSITSGNSTTTSGSNSTWDGNDNFPEVNRAYKAGGAIRIGTGDNPGSITSKSLEVEAGTLTVSFDVKGWSTVEGDIKVTAGSQNQTITYTSKMANSFESKSVSFTITTASSMTVILETTAKRAFLDNVVISNTTSGGSGGGVTETSDVLNRDFTGITNTTYTDWSGKTGTSGAVYAGNSAGGNNAIQLRSDNSNSGIVTTTSGGKVTKVVVTWNSNTASGRTLDIYGKDTAYSAATDLYNSSNQGTLLGSISKGSTTLNISNDYTYIGLRSRSGALYLNEIQITWEGQSTPTVATPTFTPAAGTYYEAQNVAINCATSDATIYYTTDGSTPSTNSSVYSSAIPVSASTTIKAIAVKSDMTNSAVATAEYVIRAATPTFSPAAATYTTPQNVTISCSTSGATIYFTTDGMEPTTNSSVFSSAIPVSSTTTIKAIAVKSGMDNSTVATATYTINLPHTVTFNAGNGTCSQTPVTEPTGTSITLPTATPSTTCADAGWTFAGWATSNVDYTTTAPTLYTDSYTITSSTTLYAVYKNGDGSGESFEYVFSEQDFSNAQEIFSDEMDATSGIGWAATTGGSNTPKYYDTGKGLRVYNGGSFTITTNNNTISAVSLTFSGTSYTFNADDSNPTTWSGNQSANITWNVTQTCRLQKVNVTYGTLTYTYATSPDCTDLTVSESSLSFLYEGGAGSFDFTVSNPVSGATATATASESWITNVAVSGNTVNFQVAYNDGQARSAEITLTYSKNGQTLATATVTVNQDANASLPGSAEDPYTVEQAIENTPSSGEVYVKGIVSEIIEIEVMQYHNARYYISDDGSTSSTQLLAFYGRNINNTDFLSEDELLVGDSVVVKGRLKMYNTTHELDEGNYIVSLTRSVQPVVFSPGSCVWPVSLWVNLFTESLFDYDGTQIHYTTNGGDPRTDSSPVFEDSWAADLELTQTTTLKAAAYVPELEKWSAVTEATYTIVPEGSGGWQGQPYTVPEALAALTTEHPDIKGAYVHGIVSRITQIDTTRYYNATYYISEDGGENNELSVYRGKYISRADFTSTDQLKPGDEVTVFGDLTIYKGTIKQFKPKNYIEDWYRSASIMISPDHFDFSCNAASGLINVIYSSDIQVYDYTPTVQFCDADGEPATYGWLTVASSPDNEWDLEYDIEANDGDQPRTAYLRVWGLDNQSHDVASNIISITQNKFQVDFAELPFSFSGGHNDIDDTPGLTGEYLGTYAAENTRLKFGNPSADQISMLVLKINEVPGVLTYDIKGNVMEGGTFKVQESSNGITYSDVASYSGLANNLQSVTIDNLSPSTRYIRWIYVTKNKGNVGVGNIHLYKPIVNYDLVVNNPMDGETQIGAISANPAGPSIPAGTDVALSISYDNNSYYFVEWVVEDATGNPVAVTDNHFTMPAANVTVTATLVSVNTPCAYAFSVNGQMGDQQSVTMGNAVQMPTNSDITFNGQTFTFRGWTTNPDNVMDLLRAGTNYTMMHDETFYAVYNQQVTGTEAEKQYAKVTRELSDWSGDYLIVYEDGNVAFNGALETLDAANNTVAVTISNGIIDATETMNAAKFTIAAVDDGYSIKSASGKYIGRDASSNGLNAHATTVYVNTISYTHSGVIEIQGAGGAYLKYNTSSDNTRFRYYMSGQKAIQLYKYVGSVNNLYTRIFMNETDNSVIIEGPSIIPNGSVLEAPTITNTLGADRLLVDEGGQLVTSSDVNATVRKTITPYAEEHGTDHYYLIASPVDDLNPTTAGMTGDDFDLFAFDQSFQGEEWRNYKADDFNLAARQGYLYANNYGGFINMGGTMAANAAGVTITEVIGKPFAGLNLIGNPYPCNVTINKPFYRLVEGGAALATEATDNTVAIAPMEGVFVCADGTETVSFAKAPTTSTTDGRNLLSMRVSRNRSSKDDRVETDNAIVRFGEGAMLRKLVLNQELSQLYVEQEGTDYAIVNAEAEGELPVSFRAAENGSYTLSVAAEGVTMRYLHLIDLKTGADVDLLQTPYYTFTAQTTDYESRFRLVFATGSSTSSETGNFAYYDGSVWMVTGYYDNATLQVVDMMGRVLSSQTVNGSAELNINQAQGVYVLRLINGNEIKSQKIVVR